MLASAVCALVLGAVLRASSRLSASSAGALPKRESLVVVRLRVAVAFGSTAASRLVLAIGSGSGSAMV